MPDLFLAFFVSVLVLGFVINMNTIILWARAPEDEARRRRRLALAAVAAVFQIVLAYLLFRVVAAVVS